MTSTVRIVSVASPGALARASTKTADLLISSGQPMMARNGVVVVLPPKVRDVAIALLARRGASFTVHDLIDHIYSLDVDGGPLSAPAAIRRHIYDLRSVAAALDMRLEVFGNTYSARAS